MEQEPKRDAPGDVGKIGTVGEGSGEAEKGYSRPQNRQGRGRKTRTGKAASQPASQPGTEKAQEKAQSVLGSNGDRPAESAPTLSEHNVEINQEPFPRPEPTPLVSAPDLAQVSSSFIVLSLLDGIVTMAFGVKCSLTPQERKVLNEPLERMLKRLPVNVSENLSKWADPILFTMGLIAWGNRIARIRREEQPAQPKEKPKTAPAQEPVSVNVPVEDMDLFSSMVPPSMITSMYGVVEPYR